MEKEMNKNVQGIIGLLALIFVIFCAYAIPPMIEEMQTKESARHTAMKKI